MDAFDQWQSILTVLLAAVPWMFPNLAAHWKIVILLLVLLISAILYCVRLARKNKNLCEKYKEIQANHRALSERFTAKCSDVKRYEDMLLSIELLVTATLQSDSNERLRTLYDGFLAIKKNLLNTGRVNEND